MEINPNHPLIHKFSERLEKDAKDPVLEDYAELLLGYALLAEGAELPDPVKFNRLVISLMEKSL
jgi:molecular chaperone HtpG